jgi:hypothetical protein
VAPTELGAAINETEAHTACGGTSAACCGSIAGVATLREYFEGQFGKYAKLTDEVQLSSSSGIIWKADARLHLAFDEYVIFLSYYVKEEFAAPENLQALIERSSDSINLLRSRTSIGGGHIVYEPAAISSDDLPFTGRIILWVEANLDDVTKQSLIAFGTSLGLRIQIRDRAYQQFLNDLERPLGFISHDSRDKADFVEPLATQLRSALCPVWYDEFSLRPGMSIRESIDAGLRESKRCVIVLSPNFLGNPGWGKAEFNAAINKHIYSGGNVIIPIWHGVTREQVAEYSPLIVDLYAINTNVGNEEVFRQVRAALLAP